MEVKMGEYTISCRSFDENKHCAECKTMYDAGYQFMYLSCGCGCGTSFEICSICSPMYMKCDCGCNGAYAECTQRPEYGNLAVCNNKYLIFLFFFLFFNIYLLDVKRFEDNLFIKEINNKYH